MEPNMCVLMDFENIAAGAEKEGHGRFNTRAVMTRLKEKGRILIARSYGDWGRFAKYKQDMLEHAVQAIELTSYRGQEKNRADIALAVDAMELAFRRDYIDTFVLLSGDSDFTPLVMRLRELNRRVIGIGTRRSSSRLLVESCDEFIFYESIKRGRKAPEKQPTTDAVESLGKDEALALLVETIEGLQKDEPGPALAGRVKQSLLRKEPTFDETEYGYSGFARFLEAAREKGLVSLSKDQRAGGYRVDLPTDDNGDSEPVEESEEQPALTGEAGRLRGVLLRQGIDPLDALSRHVVVHEFVDHVTERARRKKRNTLIYTVGDVARRTRQTEPPVKTRQVRSVLQSVFEAGELIHADGNPIRKDTAPFTLRNDAEEILRALRAYYVAALLRQGEKLGDSQSLSLLLWGDEDHATPAEELVAWIQHELSLEGTADAPAAQSAAGEGEPPAGADEMESTPASDASGGDDEAAAEAPPKRKRRRRSRRKRTDDAAPTEAADAAPAEDAPPAEQAAPADAAPTDAAPAEAADAAPAEDAPAEAADAAPAEDAPAEAADATPAEAADAAPAEAADAAPAEDAPPAEQAAPKRKRVRRRTTRKTTDTATSVSTADSAVDATADSAADATAESTPDSTADAGAADPEQDSAS